MAYMSQEKKAVIAPKVKAICKKYGMAGSLAVRHNSTLVLNIKSGALDMVTNCNRIKALSTAVRTGMVSADPVKGYVDVNVYHYKTQFDGKCKDFLEEVITAMNAGNHDRSDSQSDYFDVGWYIDVNIGKWDKPYVVVK